MANFRGVSGGVSFRGASRAVSFRGASWEDLPAVLELLEDARLPLAGVSEHIGNFVLALDGAVVGCAGLEVYGEAGLLRSVAVDLNYRSLGVGAGLTQKVLELAAARGLSSVSLLTNTAPGYFSRFGLARVERSELPAALAESAEFQGACPDSAVAMMRPV